jgi:hypothetical protein
MSKVVLKKYVVRLDAEERARLEALIGKGKHSASTILRARILLKADISEAGEAWSDGRIVKVFDTSLATVHSVRQCLFEEGLDMALSRKPPRETVDPPDLRWRKGSQTDHAGLLEASGRAREMVAPLTGTEGRGTGDRHQGQ